MIIAKKEREGMQAKNIYYTCFIAITHVTESVPYPHTHIHTHAYVYRKHAMYVCVWWWLKIYK